MPFALGPLQTKWLEALESGEYKQCKTTLYDGVGYCCLGVAVKAVLNKPLKEYEQSVLSREDFIALGLFSDNGSPQVPDYRGCMAEMNDNGMSFKEIAAILRATPTTYFQEPK